MQSLANPTESVLPPELRVRTNRFANILAISSLVIKELSRRKDFYVLFILTALVTLVMASANFFSVEQVSRYLREICLFLIWVSSLVIAVVTTARQIPAERENRTLFPLLAKPVTRNDLVVGKFLGCWLATGLALVVFYFFLGLVSCLREHQWPLGNHFQALVLHWFMIGIVCAMTVLGSVILAAPSSTNTIVLVIATAILLVGRHLNKVAVGLEEPGQTIVYSLYYVLPHLELFDLRDLLIHDWALVRWPIFGAAVGYALVYITLFLSLACLAFRRKPIH
jgi:ABC-type transport system involved in multi-copper enzyme maturation permease subunit